MTIFLQFHLLYFLELGGDRYMYCPYMGNGNMAVGPMDLEIIECEGPFLGFT